MPDSVTVHVVIPVFNRRVYTAKCLQQLREQTWKALQVVVIDDGSSDGTAEMLATDFPEVTLLKGDGGLYWTAAVYMGVEEALRSASNEDYILVLNDDLIFSERFIEHLIGESRRHPKALIHALNSFSDEPDIIDFGGLHINWWTAKYRWINRGRRRSEFPTGHCEPSSVLWGRGLLVPAKVFREIGNYDRRIVHRGDPELTRRAAKAGYDLLISYDAVAQMYREKNPNLDDRESYALTEFGNYFFGVLAPCNLKIMFLNSMLMTKNRIQGAVFFGFSLMRNLWHFTSRVRRI